MAAKNVIGKRSGGNGRRSACVACGGLVYVSGITTVDLEADIIGQAQDVLGQIERLLAANSSDKNHVLSVNVYLSSMQDYAGFNSVWDSWVSDGMEPARCVVQAGLALPQYRLKVSLIAAQS